MPEELSILLVFTAGLLSFFSPCILPLIPSYLGILGGTGFSAQPSLDKSAEQRRLKQARLFKAALGFVLGFSIVFITMGLLVSTTFFFMGGGARYINLAAGIIVIILGLNIIFDFIPFLNYEKRPFFSKQMKSAQEQPVQKYPNLKAAAAAFIAGMAFGAGWTPCIGPILTGILLLAAQGGSTGTAIFFLAVYSFGLALPFLAAALSFDFFLKIGSRFRSKMPYIRFFSGILLVIIGFIILIGQYSALTQLFER